VTQIAAPCRWCTRRDWAPRDMTSPNVMLRETAPWRHRTLAWCARCGKHASTLTACCSESRLHASRAGAGEPQRCAL